jgi:hypothetical protein
MGKLRVAAGAAAGVFCSLALLGACAPISSPPSISDPGGVPVRDVIQAIKCELLHAVVEPMQRKDTKWFLSYTAKIDLTLNVSMLNQLTPTVVFNNPLHNAYPNVGTSSLPGAALSAFQQKFTFGVGGGVSDIRSRAEDLNFTLGLKDLRDDLTLLSTTHPQYLPCLDPNATLEFSNLDIKSWIDRRVLPLVEKVDGYQVLREGHPTQVAGTSGKPPSALGPRPPFAAILDLPTALKAAHDAGAAADYVSTRVLPFAQKVGGNCGNTILEDSLLASDEAATARLQVKIADTDQRNNGGNLSDKGQDAVQAAINAAKSAFDIAQSAYKTATDPAICPVPPPPSAPQKTPPLDTISSNYTFNVTANIGIAPSWTLVRVTGPSGAGSAASTAGAWTNNVSIILAPAVASNVNLDVNNQRLIQSLRPPPVPPVAAPF